MFNKGRLAGQERRSNRLLFGALPTVATLGFIGAFCYAQSASTKPSYLAGSLERDEPQAIYAADAKDSWNRIFYCLFTRTVQTRLTSDFISDFTSDAPFDSVEVMGLPHLKASTRTFARIESGDRAIEPFYPSFFSSEGALQMLI